MVTTDSANFKLCGKKQKIKMRNFGRKFYIFDRFAKKQLAYNNRD